MHDTEFIVNCWSWCTWIYSCAPSVSPWNRAMCLPVCVSTHAGISCEVRENTPSLSLFFTSLDGLLYIDELSGLGPFHFRQTQRRKLIFFLLSASVLEPSREAEVLKATTLMNLFRTKSGKIEASQLKPTVWRHPNFMHQHVRLLLTNGILRYLSSFLGKKDYLAKSRMLRGSFF